MDSDWVEIRAILERLDRIEKILRQERLQNKWLTLRKASKYTGLSESTLRRAIMAGRLKASKPSGKIAISIEWLDRFMGSGKY